MPRAEQIHVAGWPCLGVLDNVPALSPSSIMAAHSTYTLEGNAFVITAIQIMSDDGARQFPTSDGDLPPVYAGGGYARRLPPSFRPDHRASKSDPRRHRYASISPKTPSIRRGTTPVHTSPPWSSTAAPKNPSSNHEKRDPEPFNDVSLEDDNDAGPARQPKGRQDGPSVDQAVILQSRLALGRHQEAFRRPLP